MKHLKPYFIFNEDADPSTVPTAAPASTTSTADVASFTKELESWNKTYSGAFKFVNDIANQIEPAYVGKVKEAVAKLAPLLKKQPDIKFQIVAHTSSPTAGKAWGGSNEKLSQARAEFIKAQLVRIGGLKPESFTVLGKGATELLVKDDTTGSPEQQSAKQLQNRRAEVKIEGQIQGVIINAEKLQITQTQFIPDTIIPTIIKDGASLRERFRIWNKTRAAKNKKVGAEKFPLYADTPQEIGAKVAAMDTTPLMPGSDTELYKKLLEIGQYFAKNLMSKGIKLRLTGYTIDTDTAYAPILAQARAEYMKKVLNTLVPAVKADMVVAVGQMTKGGLDKIKATVDFIDAQGKVVDTNK